MGNSSFIKATGIWYKNEINTIKKKSDVHLQPVFEAIMNAWESILDRFSNEYFKEGRIGIAIYRVKNLLSKESDEGDFEKMIVSDNGNGLDSDSYKRLINLRDDTKNHSNLGTGRVQFIHFFKYTTITSIYKTEEQFKKRKVTLSKDEVFLRENAIMLLDEDENSTETNLKTEVSFMAPLNDKDKVYYSSLTVQDLKDAIVRHFLPLFCDYRNQMPQIHISLLEDEDTKEECDIALSDIPNPDKEEKLSIGYRKLDEKNKIVPSGHFESFCLKAFKRPSSEIKQNAIYLVSKGTTGDPIDIGSLQKTDKIDGNRYMFLLSGEYLDTSRDDRGNIRLFSAQEFKHQNEDNMLQEEAVLYDDIVDETNKSINKLYTELDAKNQEKNKTIDELQKMFLLNPVTVSEIRQKIKNTDSEEKILKVIYQADSEIEAEKDDAIRRQMEELESLMSTKTDDYQIKLKKMVDELMTAIPLQNRTVLSKYIARRKLVLELFDKILHKELEVLKGGKRIDEKILHNLLFQQSSTSNAPEDSDLWIINEEFIYFKGVSEARFEDIEYNGKKVFAKEFSEEDKRYLNSLGEKRLTMRPDVLLFPEENKAIIIEFKAPDVNVSDHLTQIDFYANILLNYTIDELQLTTFYGYLIGEEIEDRDVRGRVSRFEYSPKFNYWFRPSEKVINFNNGFDGNLYTEVIKYSTLLERAKLRNQIFIDKLINGNNNGLAS